MCYNCGCSIPHDDMGDVKNITENSLKDLAHRKNITLIELKKDLLVKLELDDDTDEHYQKLFKDASSAWGQQIKEARKETRKLLKKQFQS